ncbi:MAG TPA: hypothetical protein VLK89_04670 [Solirubrobacterales bacterium]|nr:hypothetical protein [Solirubrobacterales bacterium]
MRRGSGWAILLTAALAAVTAPTGAGAATVVNGDFESGTLAGWNVSQETEAGNWFVYKGTEAPIGRHRKNSAPLQAPPQGVYAATTDEANPDTLILYQDIALEAGYTHRLSMLVYYNSYDPIAIPKPDTLSVDEEALGGQASQQYRIDVMKPDAPLDSVNPADILRTVFQTKPHDPEAMSPTKLTVDLTPFAGQTVRLRIANAAHEEVFNAGADAISISSTLPGGSRGPSGAQSGGSKHGPVLFSFDKLRANRRDGTVALKVRVSGPGLLRAKGASTPTGTARTSRAGKPQRPIEPVTVPVALPKTVTIHLRPTPSARAVLERKRRLRVEVAVTYMPTDASPETASLPVVFRLGTHPRHLH